MTKCSDLEVIKWLWSHFSSFQPDQQKTISRLVSFTRLLLELAASKCGPAIPLASSTFDIAICKGSKKLLWWLLYESNQVPAGCSPGRTLLIVHGHGWSIPGQSSNLWLAHAEQLFVAFYGAAHSHRLLRRSPANVGSLPDVLLKKIACDAEIDFSWTLAT